MPGSQRSDGWEALRERLERSTGTRWRGGWVPPRRADDSDSSTHDDLSRARSGRGDLEDPRRPAQTMTLGRAHLAVVALVSVAALAGTVAVLVSAQPREQAVPLAASPEATPTASPPTRRAETAPAAPAAASPETVMVHVVGQVHRAGVVAVPGGSRVVDALEAVGGPTADADLTTVNLARLVRDGEQIRVGLPPDASVAQGSGGGGAPLDLNAASAAELEELPGVGPVLADRIVAYRDESGPFRSVDQLIEVPGIGPAVLGSLDGRVKV